MTQHSVGRSEDLEIGKAAEHLVCADLILQGYRAFLSDQGLPYDVVVDLDGRLLRLQVKGTRFARKAPQRVAFTPGYLFHVRRAGKGARRRYTEREFDLVAFAALDIRIVAYLPMNVAMPSCIILRPPGYSPHGRAVRPENIDQLPFDRALSLLDAPPERALTLAKRLKAECERHEDEVDLAIAERRLAEIAEDGGRLITGDELKARLEGTGQTFGEVQAARGQKAA